MQTLSALDTIKALQSCRHQTSKNHTPSLFDTHNNFKSTDYWFASDIYNIIPRLQITLSKNIYDQVYNLANTQSNMDILASLQEHLPSFYQIISRHTEPIKHDYLLRHHTPSHPTQNIKNGNDARLSRFACFTVVYNTGHNPAAYLATAYFMQPNAPASQIIQTANDIERITERARCKKLEKRMCSIINTETKIPIGVVYNKIHHAFMGNESANTLRRKFNITDTSTLTNYLSADALRVRNDAIEHSISHFASTKIRTKQTFTYLISQEMTKARNIIFTQTGKLPKLHITPIHIQACGDALTNLRIDFITKHILDDIHTK